MEQESKWERCWITCPEDNTEAELLVEWREEDGKLTANSISCNNSKLLDLKPVDCNWSCWEEIDSKDR
jgi:hypothetical protein